MPRGPAHGNGPPDRAAACHPIAIARVHGVARGGEGGVIRAEAWAMTIRTVRILCASCGAALAIPPDLDRLSCAHCGTPLIIVHGDGFVAARLARAVTRAVETSAAATRAELQRLQLGQERFSLEERALRRAGQAGIPFLPGPLTEVQREWNRAVARLGAVEDALGEPRSYIAVSRRPFLSWPPDARG